MATENDTREMEVSGSVSNSTVILANLRSTYAFRIQMCTRVGCGPWSPPFYISVEKGKCHRLAYLAVVSIFAIVSNSGRLGFHKQAKVRETEFLPRSMNYTLYYQTLNSPS